MSAPPDALTIAREALAEIVLHADMPAGESWEAAYVEVTSMARDAVEKLPPVADPPGRGGAGKCDPEIRECQSCGAKMYEERTEPTSADYCCDGGEPYWQCPDCGESVPYEEADPSGQPPLTLTLRYCAMCGCSALLGERGDWTHDYACPGTVQTLTYRLDAGQPDEPLTNSWNRPGWTGEVPAEAVDHIYSRLDGGAFGTTSKDAIKAVLHAAGMVLAEPDTAPAQAPRMGLSGNLRTTGDGLVAEAFAAGGPPDGQSEPQYEYRAVIGGWGSHALPSEASASVTLRDHWLPAGYDPHIERRVSGAAPGPWERLDVPDTPRCPRASDWCTGDNCEALGRPDCPNSDAARGDVPDTTGGWP